MLYIAQHVRLARRIHAYSRGAQRVLCAFRGDQGLATVFGQLKGAEQDVLCAIIKNTRKKLENRDLKFITIAAIFRILTFFPEGLQHPIWGSKCSQSSC